MEATQKGLLLLGIVLQQDACFSGQLSSRVPSRIYFTLPLAKLTLESEKVLEVPFGIREIGDVR
jgi:hypothetical protein